MANLLICNKVIPFPSLPLSPFTVIRPFSTPSKLWFSPAVTFHNNPFLRRPRDLRLVTNAGASANSYIFAFSIPFSLILGTVLTALKIGSDLDRKFLEELAINQAIMEANEENEEGSPELSFEEKPALPRTRNRPKREIEV